MSQIIFASRALRDLQRLREFLRQKNPAAAKRAAAAIVDAIRLLEANSEIGRPVDEMDITYRELPIQFGDRGNIALYRYDKDTVTVLSIRHQKEAGY